MALYLGTAGAVQDARAWPSRGFRPPFGLGRVTLERPKVTKGLLPRQSAGFASALGPEPTSGGPPQMAHPCAGCGYAIIPDGVPDVASDPRRIGGGINTVPTCGLGFGEGIALKVDCTKWLVAAYVRLEAL